MRDNFTRKFGLYFIFEFGHACKQANKVLYIQSRGVLYNRVLYIYSPMVCLLVSCLVLSAGLGGMEILQPMNLQDLL